MYILAGFAELGAARAGALVLDPDPVSRDGLLSVLAEAGYRADGSRSDDEALARIDRRHHGVLIIAYPRRLDDNVALARRIQQTRDDISIVLFVADDETKAALATLQTGATNFMTTCFEPPRLAGYLLDVVERALAGTQWESTRTQPVPGPSRDAVRDVLVGECTLIEHARQDVRRILARRTPVLIQGEAGTEKLALARLLHGAGALDRPFVIVDTAPGDGVEGARERLPSERRGTLFFPEVSSLDGGWQAALVELLSEPGDGSIDTEPRIVAGLSHPPAPSWEGSVLCRRFFSLGSQTLLLPPLRERGRDIERLSEHFAEQARLERGDASLRFTGAALEALSAYGWPGNVDELRLAVQHAASLCTASSIEVSDLPPCIAVGATGLPDESGARWRVQSLQDMEVAYICQVLAAVGGNKALAARLLGVDRTTLYRKLQRHEQGAGVRPLEGPPSRTRRR